MRIHWPNGVTTEVAPGTDWLQAALEAQLPIPTGCLGGSCGACEITVNGDTVRACVAVVPTSDDGDLTVDWCADPSW
ncbi:MAG: 2Fe-2S iron-sulfur cluster-binding protein [Cyanobacteriota bacterium]|jgi:ferredoxin